jgi:hypothetical protein
MTHTLSPRTNVGVDLNSVRSFSRNQDAYVFNGSMFVERTLTPRLSAHANLGVGFVKPIRTSAAVLDRPEMTANGSLTYKVSQQTLTVSATRSVADSFGLGANLFDSYTGSWGYVPRGSNWSFQINGGIDKMQNARYGSLDVWRAAAGMTRRIGPFMFFSAQYSRMSFSNNDLRASVANYQTGLEGVALSLVITPRRQPMF